MVSSVTIVRRTYRYLHPDGSTSCQTVLQCPHQARAQTRHPCFGAARPEAAEFTLDWRNPTDYKYAQCEPEGDSTAPPGRRDTISLHGSQPTSIPQVR
eukprot:s2742_g6.t3